KNWLETVHFAMKNFKDESFISQYLSPKVIRDLKLFAINDDEKNNFVEISSIHNDEGYLNIRQKLSAQYNLSNREPNIQVVNVDLHGNRALTLRHIPHKNIPLHQSYEQVLKHAHKLWGFDVILEQELADGKSIILGSYPEKLTK
ncbi:MAG: SpoVR family protein, partial [Vibrionaceae bacterium]